MKEDLKMKIPHTIPKNVFETYRCSYESSRLSRERRILAEDETWDEGGVPSLKTLALRVIALTWKNNPILKELPTCGDRTTLIEILPTDLPFDLAITKIEDEYYWERCSLERWEFNDPTEHNNSWRQRYCEGHFCEYLENLEPSYFETQKDECQKVIGLVQDYVHAIKLRSLLPTKKRIKSLDVEDPCVVEEEPVNHIPMSIILPKLPHLVEIYVVFGVIYMNNGFEWRDFEFSEEDCKNLGEGIKGCPKLKKFTLSRSSLDQPRAAALLQGVVENDNIEEIDLSHCKLADTGAHAVGEFLSLHKNLKTLHLTNNNIGPSGVAGIVYGLLKREKMILKHLDLRLNPLLDSGMVHVCAYLLRCENLEVLNVSGCSMTADGGAALVEVLSSGYIKLTNLSIDVSNNDFGEAVGEALEAALKSISFINGLDVRMCNVSRQTEYFIHENILKHKEKVKKNNIKSMLGRVSSQRRFTNPTLL